MGVSPFKAAIDAVLAPLEFAARSDFAHFDRVRALGETVSAGLKSMNLLLKTGK